MQVAYNCKYLLKETIKELFATFHYLFTHLTFHLASAFPFPKAPINLLFHCTRALPYQFGHLFTSFTIDFSIKSQTLSINFCFKPFVWFE